MTRAALPVRFGYGAGPGMPEAPATMLRALRGPDRAAALHRPETDGRAAFVALREGRAARRADPSVDLEPVYVRIRTQLLEHARVSLARILDAPDAFRERLVWFWADHLAISARSRVERALAGTYVEEAIRPHVAGRFEDMLEAATLHPAMLVYLDATTSIGPASPIGRRRGRGLNENHARELLELHTLGVGGPYDQGDVRELAELMTGHWMNAEGRAGFRPRAAEPGAETVLGRRYGGDPGRGGHLREALADLAHHPATARHMARKLAVHFVADAPPEDLVEALEGAWRGTGGDLPAVYAALLAHPAAHAPPGAKLRRPFEWMATALRALGLPGSAVRGLDARETNRLLLGPLIRMGQEFMRPPGPDGWDEAARAWAGPQTLAERIGWAMRVPTRLLPALPDPRALVQAALPWGVPERLAFAAGAAESRRDGVGLVLVSPAVMRR